MPVPWNEFLAGHHLKEELFKGTAEYLFTDVRNNAAAGRLHYMHGDLRNQKAKCSRHPGCGCWITLRDNSNNDAFSLLRRLVAWLGSDCSAKEHACLSYEAKLDFGLRAKKPACYDSMR